MIQKINCNKVGGCNNKLLQCKSNNDCKISCDQCIDTIINCPLHKKCIIQCNDKLSCHRVRINAIYSSSLRIISKSIPMAINDIYIQCPSNGPCDLFCKAGSCRMVDIASTTLKDNIQNAILNVYADGQYAFGYDSIIQCTSGAECNLYCNGISGIPACENMITINGTEAKKISIKLDHGINFNYQSVINCPVGNGQCIIDIQNGATFGYDTNISYPFQSSFHVNCRGDNHCIQSMKGIIDCENNQISCTQIFTNSNHSDLMSIIGLIFLIVVIFTAFIPSTLSKKKLKLTAVQLSVLLSSSIKFGTKET